MVVLRDRNNHATEPKDYTLTNDLPILTMINLMLRGG